MKRAFLGSVLLVACATSEGVEPGGPALGGGGAAASGGIGAGGSAVAGAGGGAAGAVQGGMGGTAGLGATGGVGATGGGGTGGVGATGGGGTGGVGATGGGTGGVGATGGGGTGGAPGCGITGCATGSESMSGCSAARTIGRTAASSSSGYQNTASTCSATNKSTDYDSANCWDFGKDHLYRIFLRKGESVDVTITQGSKCSGATSWDRVFKIYSGSTCSDTTCSKKLSCASTGSGTYNKSYTATTEGWHFLVVDGRTAPTAFDDSGSYSIIVKLTCAVTGCEC